MLSPLVEMRGRRLRRQQQAQHVDVEHLMELRLADRLQRSEFVDARVVDQGVEPPIGDNGGANFPLKRR